MATKPPLALIAGPTASGKSALGVELALALEKQGRRGVIINADSAQVYGDLQIVSARPDTKEMAGVEHRLFGTWDGAHPCSAADWATAAKHEITDIHGQGAIPILVGGTGLYIQVLLDGIAPIPVIDTQIRDEVRAMDTAAAYAALQLEDPLRAEKLEPGDSQRISRALEVVRGTGRRLTDWQKHKEGGISADITLHPLILLPKREWLYDRCNRRFEMMLDGGALQEIEALISRQIDPALPVMRAIGVPEIIKLLHSEMSREEAKMAASQATRNYAKRQYTWFRRQTPTVWPKVESGIDGTLNYDISTIFASLLRN